VEVVEVAEVVVLIVIVVGMNNNKTRLSLRNYWASSLYLHLEDQLILLLMSPKLSHLNPMIH